VRTRFLYYVLPAYLLASVLAGSAQRYQAMHGSPMAGSLGLPNNPASIIHVPFNWDLTLFSVQEQHTTNSILLKNASFRDFKDAEVFALTGPGRRYAMMNQDLRLLNARIKLDYRQAIAFGLNIRSGLSAQTSSFNWQDTLANLYQFLDINRGSLPLTARVRASTWAEIFGTYARTLIDDGSTILNAGVTFTLNRGLGGGFLTGSDINYFPSASSGTPAYNLATGSLQYGYSANVDDIDDNGFDREQLLKQTRSSISASLGIEYIILDSESEGSYDYDWKIGVSLLDVGGASYKYGRNSRFAGFSKENITDSIVEQAFENVNSLEDVADSVDRIAAVSSIPTGNFNIAHPSRLVINVDRHLQGNFFVNGELIVPLTSLLSADKLFIRDMNLLAITPRYETRLLGAYLPVTLNREKQVWIGGAFRAGPLLLGVHNWANLFSKNKMSRGGFYLALTFRPGRKKEAGNDAARDANGTPLSKKQLRYLDCPRF
jgi:hypothetical protein